MADSKSIYLGNIFTIEADLNLPFTGPLGSVISWQTDKPHIIDERGHVVRPRAGAGNREVKLVATISYENERTEREFIATVLEESDDLGITELLPMNFQMIAPIKLPPVAVGVSEGGRLRAVSVKWHLPEELPCPGKYEITGEAQGTDLVPKVQLTILEKNPETPNGPKPVVSFLNNNVKISDGPFKISKDRMEAFLLSVNDDTMLYNFFEAANIQNNAPPMTGWDSPDGLLRGHTTGHYLSALALAYNGADENKASLLKKLNYIVDGLKQVQDVMAATGKFAPGFLSGYDESQFDQLEEYVVYPKIWAPYYTLHKIMAGLLDAYQYAHNETALDVCKKMGLWVYNRLSKCSKEQRDKMWSMYIAGEYGGMNEVMAKLYQVEPREEYLISALFFDNEKLFWPISENLDVLGGFHANQHIPQILGALSVYEANGDIFYLNVARNFWEMVTDAHTYNLGGTGEGEMFQKRHHVAKALTTKTAESCPSYNLLKLSARLFSYNPDSKFMDYYERALINHILANQDPSGPTGGTTYFMPLCPGAQKGFDLTENTCCHGTGMESPVKYQEAIYFADDNQIFVNLYIPSELEFNNLRLIQTGDYLRGQTVRFHLEKGNTTLRFRKPGWLTEIPIIEINGKTMEAPLENGYYSIEARENDKISLLFPFSLRIESAPDDESVFSVFNGPVLMALKSDQKEMIKVEKVEELPSLVPFYEIDKEAYHVYFKKITF